MTDPGVAAELFAPPNILLDRAEEGGGSFLWPAGS